MYVNGVPYQDPDLAQMPANEYAGVEYYTSGATAPPLYNGTKSACGVLLLWTRER